MLMQVKLDLVTTRKIINFRTLERKLLRPLVNRSQSSQVGRPAILAHQGPHEETQNTCTGCKTSMQVITKTVFVVMNWKTFLTLSKETGAQTGVASQAMAPGLPRTNWNTDCQAPTCRQNMERTQFVWQPMQATVITLVTLTKIMISKILTAP